MRYRLKGEDGKGTLLALPYNAQGELLAVPCDGAETLMAQIRRAVCGRGGEVERAFGALTWEDVTHLTEPLTAVNPDGYRLTLELLDYEDSDTN